MRNTLISVKRIRWHEHEKRMREKEVQSAMKKRLLAVMMALAVCAGGAVNVCASQTGEAGVEGTQAVEGQQEGNEVQESLDAVAQKNPVNEDVNVSPAQLNPSAQWTLTPVPFDTLTAEQQAALKPLYDNVPSIGTTGIFEVTPSAEKTVIEAFLSDIQGMPMALVDGTTFVFGMVIPNMEPFGILTSDFAQNTAGAFDTIIFCNGTNGQWGNPMCANSVGGYGYQFKFGVPTMICAVKPSGYDENGLVIYRGKTAITTINGQEYTFLVRNRVDPYMDPYLSAEQRDALLEFNKRPDNYYNMSDEEKKAAEFAVQAPLIEQLAGKKLVTIHSFGELNIVNDTNVDISAGVPITFPAAGISAGDSVVVLHLKADGGWELIPATAGDNTITGTFTSLSPVYYFKVSFEGEAQTGASSGSAGTASAGAGDQHVHTWSDQIVAPTATTWGYTMHGCNECGYSYAENYVAPTGQSAAQGRTVSPKTGENPLPYAVMVLTGMCGFGLAAGMKKKCR